MGVKEGSYNFKTGQVFIGPEQGRSRTAKTLQNIDRTWMLSSQNVLLPVGDLRLPFVLLE